MHTLVPIANICSIAAKRFTTYTVLNPVIHSDNYYTDDFNYRLVGISKISISSYVVLHCLHVHCSWFIAGAMDHASNCLS